MNDPRQAAATARLAMRLPDEVHLEEGWANDDPNMRADFPRMLYRQTEKEVRNYQTDAAAKCGETWLVENKFDGFLCETLIVNDLDEMEQAVSDGWETSPKAAYGKEDGAKPEVSAKDARIAELEAQLAAASKPRIGRPPKGVDGTTEPDVKDAQT